MFKIRLGFQNSANIFQDELNSHWMIRQDEPNKFYALADCLATEKKEIRKLAKTLKVVLQVCKFSYVTAAAISYMNSFMEL